MAVTLECCSLGFDYGDKKILKDICFQVQSGTFCAVLGRNGSGKTTLIHCLNRILTKISGRILVHGRPLMSLAQNEIAQLISLVPQEHIDVFPYKVIDVVVMGRAPFLKIAAKPDETDYQIAANALRELNAQGLAHKNFNRISGGERQITLLARALAQTTKIMLLDEPTNHLDFNNQYHLLSSIKQLCRSKGISIVASMHDPNMATLFADDVIMLKNGEIMVQGDKNLVMTTKNISELYGTNTSEIRLNAQQKIFLPSHILEDQENG
ncbi:ABC transporter ATP-binding protein [Desulfobacula toluolica]|uniref:ABC transporter ATP-binding protein n=1 Tax=Desulfobacula toluolica TaxID=28223 RepID=UPI00059C12A7|nr:ABC transporter ATP-binding protein [Desulfobacula toluolica]